MIGVVKMKKIYSGSVCSDLNLIKNFVEDALIRLEKVIDNRDIIFDIRLILNELVINGVFHGNECKKTTCVDLSMILENSNLIIEVKDQGKGIVYDFENYDPLDLSSGGRGLILVKGLSDQLIVRDNSIIAIKALN